MLQRVRHEAEMRRPVEGSSESTRAQLQKAAERGSRAARAELAGPQLPASRRYLRATWEEIQYLWTWFWELDRTRTYSGMTGRPEPISFVALDAWARLTRRELLPHEVDALMRLDAAYLHAIAELAPAGAA